MLVPFAQDRIETQLGDVDALDSKAFSGLALAAGSVALLAALHKDLNHLWPLVIGGLILAGACFFWCLWPRTFEPGADLEKFYSEMESSTPLVAHREMLSGLLAIEDRNNKPLWRKVLLCRWGLGFLILSLIGIVLVSLAHPQTTKVRPMAKLPPPKIATVVVRKGFGMTGPVKPSPQPKPSPNGRP
jgi:hypothetical protein